MRFLNVFKGRKKKDNKPPVYNIQPAQPDSVKGEQVSTEEKSQASNRLNTSPVNLNKEIRLTVSGIPANLAKEKKKQIFKSLVCIIIPRLQNKGYRQGEKIYSGKAAYEIDGKKYELLYEFDALKLITGLNIYKEAIKQVNIGVESGQYDKKLGEDTLDFFREEAWKLLDDVFYFESTASLPSALPQDSNDNIEIISLNQQGQSIEENK